MKRHLLDKWDGSLVLNGLGLSHVMFYVYYVCLYYAAYAIFARYFLYSYFAQLHMLADEMQSHFTYRTINEAISGRWWATKSQTKIIRLQ